MSKRKVTETEDTLEGVEEKPFQAPLTGSQLLANKAIADVLLLPVAAWTKLQRKNVARVLSNRQWIDTVQDPPEVQKQLWNFIDKIDILSAEDSEFAEEADPIVVFVQPAPGAQWPPGPNYMDVLNVINGLQGGVAGAAGEIGQPVSFVNGVAQLIECNNNTTFERLVGAMKTNFPGVLLIRMNPQVEHILKERTELQPKEGGEGYEVPAEGVMLIDEATMYQPRPEEKVVRRVIPRIMPLRGYRDTQHAKDHDITQKWAPFTLNDCSPPGIKQK